MTQLQAVSTSIAVLLRGSQTENAILVERPQCKEAADDVCQSCVHGWRNANRNSKFFNDATNQCKFIDKPRVVSQAKFKINTYIGHFNLTRDFSMNDNYQKK